MTDLKPCPFCGEEAQRKVIAVPYQHGWVGCPKCGCYIQWQHDPSGAEDKWNRRVPTVMIEYNKEQIDFLDHMASKIADRLHQYGGAQHA